MCHPPECEGFWHTVLCDLMLSLPSRLCSSAFPTLRHRSGISDLQAQDEDWTLMCSRAAGKLSGGILLHTLQHPYSFPRWITIFSPGDSPLEAPMQRWGMFGVRFKIFDPPAVPKLHRLRSPPQFWHCMISSVPVVEADWTSGGRGNIP